MLPGTYIDEGEDLDRIEAEVRATVGPPAATFAELCKAADYGPGCWYIDDFADLRTGSVS
jgi:hypothetical protein